MRMPVCVWLTWMPASVLIAGKELRVRKGGGIRFVGGCVRPCMCASMGACVCIARLCGGVPACAVHVQCVQVSVPLIVACL